jgi:hypothetical protein
LALARSADEDSFRSEVEAALRDALREAGCRDIDAVVARTITDCPTLAEWVEGRVSYARAVYPLSFTEAK